MRALVPILASIVVVALVGCYRPTDPACVISCTPGDDPCPSGLVCGALSLCEPMAGPSCAGLLDARMDADDDASTDGPIDAGPIDAGPPPYCSENMFAMPTSTIPAQQFTVNVARTRMSAVGASIYINESAPGSSNMVDYIPVLGIPAGSIEIYSGRIDPAGETVFMTADNGTAMTATLAYLSRRDMANVWSSYTPVTFEDNGVTHQLPPGAVVGGSTDPALGARRMPISAGTTSFFEYVEKQVGTPTLFDLAQTTTAAMLGVQMVREPSFTPDGLRVVFSGQVGQVIGFYTATRATVTSAWQPAILLYAGSTQTTAPYVTGDCMHLYWTDNNSGRQTVHL